MEAPQATDLFGESSPKKAAKSHKEYVEVLSKSLSAPIGSKSSATAELEALLVNKSLSPDAVGALNAALAAQRSVSADIIKDITVNSPLSTSGGAAGFAAYDLEAPAKMLTPRPTPLRNKLARKKGIGNAHRIKRVTGFTGTGTGGVGVTWPGITETSYTAFGQINYERGSKISYAADDKTFNYFSYSLSDSVSFDAAYSAQGYQDLRQLSSTSTLYASMLMEERMLLMGRGTSGVGGTGAIAAPTITVTARTAAAGETALPATQIFVYATSDAGAFGESVASTVASVTPTSSQVVDVKITSPVSGALGYKYYVGTTTGAANAYYQSRTGNRTYTIQGTIATTGAVAPTADTSAYATGYDGIIPQIFAGGTVSDINSTFSTSNPGVEFQNVFSTLYNSVKADPDEIWLNGADRKQLSDAIKNGTTSNYRLNLTQDDSGNYVGGAVIGSIYNEITGKLVNLSVHPWLPQGVAPVLSYTLPIPDTEVSDVWAVVNVQDYMGIQWPVTQFAYETSTYWRGTFVGYAPAWNGIVTGITAA